MRPALILRLAVGATLIAYTGDTAWTPAITEASRDADLLIAEAYHWDKAVPHHLRYTDLTEHEITARRVILTHMSADMFARPTLYEPPRRHGDHHRTLLFVTSGPRTRGLASTGSPRRHTHTTSAGASGLRCGRYQPRPRRHGMKAQRGGGSMIAAAASRTTRQRPTMTWIPLCLNFAFRGADHDHGSFWPNVVHFGPRS